MFRSVILQAEKKSVKTSIKAITKKPSVFRAVSAATGAAYPAAIAESLDKLPFASNLWLSERQMKTIGVAVAPAHAGKGFTSKGKGGITFSLFNADQTTDRAKVETFKGRMVATSALTGEKMIGDVAQALTSSVANFPTNEWLSAKEVEGLALALKPNATPVAVSFKFTDKTELADGKESVAEREVTKMFYNVADVAKPEAVAQAAKMIPMSASSGKAYSKNMVLPLLRAAIANKFTSPFWTTLSGAQAMGLLVKDAKGRRRDRRVELQDDDVLQRRADEQRGQGRGPRVQGAVPAALRHVGQPLPRADVERALRRIDEEPPQERVLADVQAGELPRR